MFSAFMMFLRFMSLLSKLFDFFYMRLCGFKQMILRVDDAIHFNEMDRAMIMKKAKNIIKLIKRT